jgi:hypothetical protein
MIHALVCIIVSAIETDVRSTPDGKSGGNLGSDGLDTGRGRERQVYNKGRIIPNTDGIGFEGYRQRGKRSEGK